MKIKTRIRRKIVGSDFSAQEPRLTCHLSGEDKMLNAYLEGKDLYAVISAGALKNNYEDNLEFYPEGTEIEIDGKKIITGHKTHKNLQGKANRTIGKKLLLASTYGMGAARAGITMGKSKEEGQELLDNFFAEFSKVKEAIDYSKESLKKYGYVEDWFGRRRHLPKYFLPRFEIRYEDPTKNKTETFNPILGCKDRELITDKMKSYLAKAEECKGDKAFEKLQQQARKDGYILISNTGTIAQCERQCFNARIQGGAATLTKIAMVNIYFDEKLKEYGARLVCSVHDEILVECLDFYNKEVEERLPQIMIDSAKPYMKVPMSCDPYNVQRWYGDELANHILDDFKKLESKGKSFEEAKDIILEENCELPKQAVMDVLTNKKDVIEWDPDDPKVWEEQ